MRRLTPISRRVVGEDSKILADTCFQLLLLASLVVVLGATLISPILDTLINPFDASPASIGLLITAFLAPPIVLIPIGGGLADRYGRRPVLITGLVLFGGAGIAIALTTDFMIAIGLRAIQGIGFAFTLPVIITSIRDLYPGDKEATGQGLRLATSGIGNFLFPLLAGLLVVIAWQLPFLLYGLAFPVAAAMIIWFEEPTSRRDSPDDDPHESRSKREYVKEVMLLASQYPVTAVLLGRAMMAVVTFAFLTYNSLLIVNVFDGSPEQAGALVAIWGITYAGLATQVGRMNRRHNDKIMLAVVHACLGSGMVLLALAPSLLLAGGGVFLLGVGTGIGGALYRSLITGFASERLRGGLVGASESLGRFAAATTPTAMGAVIAFIEPETGTTQALQLVTCGTGLIAGSVGLLSIIIYHLTYSPAE